MSEFQGLRPKVDIERVRKLLRTPKGLLGALDEQRKFVVSLHVQQVPCPMCFVPCSLYEAGDETQTIGGIVLDRVTGEQSIWEDVPADEGSK